MHKPHFSFPRLSGSEAYKGPHSFQCSGPSPHFHTYFCNVPKRKSKRVLKEKHKWLIFKEILTQRALLHQRTA